MNVNALIDGERAEKALPTEHAEPAIRSRVLVVDDDERNLLAVRNVLEDIGEVVVAHSGDEALRHLLKASSRSFCSTSTCPDSMDTKRRISFVAANRPSASRSCSCPR